MAKVTMEDEKKAEAKMQVEAEKKAEAGTSEAEKKPEAEKKIEAGAKSKDDKENTKEDNKTDPPDNSNEIHGTEKNNTSEPVDISTGCSSLKEDSKLQGLIIKNLATEVSEQGMNSTLGTMDTEYLKAVCSCKVGSLTEEEQGKFAIVIAPKKVAHEITKLNSVELYGKAILIEEVPLEYLELRYPQTNNIGNHDENQETCEDRILEFIFPGESRALSRCVILNSEDPKIMHALIATTLELEELPGKDIVDIIRKTTEEVFLQAVEKKYETKKDFTNNNAQVVVKKKDKPNEESKKDIEIITTQIRQYSMNVCKQMKRKLLYLDRKNFAIRNNKGSVNKEQLYIDCSTAMYEYMRFYLISILKERFKCTEDLQKRKVIQDNEDQRRSEVEAQYSIQYVYNGTRHNVHLTFYYTKCSILVQGTSTKIETLTVAQFFSCHYIEKISNMVENMAPLKDISNELKKRISSFLSDEETSKLTTGDESKIEERSSKCVSCSRNCQDNNKSIACCKCNHKQHFKCAGIISDAEREVFLSNSEQFVCSKCLPNHQITIDISDDPPVLAKNIEEEDKPPENTRNQDKDIPDGVNIKPIERSVTDTSLDDPTNDNNSKPVENSARDGHLNVDKLTIRRLQQDMTKLIEEHEKKQSQLEDEISTLREAYRRCMNDYEREKDTKETLEKCLNALQSNKVKNSEVMRTQNNKENKEKHDGDQTASNGNQDSNERENNDGSSKNRKNCRYFNRPSGCKKGDQCKFTHKLNLPRADQSNSLRSNGPHHDNGESESIDNTNRNCRFFNRRSGCNKGDQCKFTHKHMPPCNNGPECGKWRCLFDHKDGNGSNFGKKKGTCRFYNTRNGCKPKNGKPCPYTHVPQYNEDDSGEERWNFNHTTRTKDQTPPFTLEGQNHRPDPNQESLAATNIQKIIQNQIQEEMAKITSTKLNQYYNQMPVIPNQPPQNTTQTSSTASTFNTNQNNNRLSDKMHTSNQQITPTYSHPTHLPHFPFQYQHQFPQNSTAQMIYSY